MKFPIKIQLSIPQHDMFKGVISKLVQNGDCAYYALQLRFYDYEGVSAVRFAILEHRPKPGSPGKHFLTWDAVLNKLEKATIKSAATLAVKEHLEKQFRAERPC